MIEDPHPPIDRGTIGARIPRWAWAVFAVLYLVIVPWYAPSDWIDPTCWAFPAWAVVTIVAAAALAAFNAYAFLRLWPRDATNEDERDTT